MRRKRGANMRFTSSCMAELLHEQARQLGPLRIGMIRKKLTYGTYTAYIKPYAKLNEAYGNVNWFGPAS
jgi:hypothetical protein